jgi:hypothetical protein
MQFDHRVLRRHHDGEFRKMIKRPYVPKTVFFRNFDEADQIRDGNIQIAAQAQIQWIARKCIESKSFEQDQVFIGAGLAHGPAERVGDFHVLARQCRSELVQAQRFGEELVGH